MATAEDGIPVFEFTIDDKGTSTGVKAISLVDEPAIESDFVYFNKEKNRQYIKLEIEGYKNTVLGLALIPDKYILRMDKNNNPYYGYFSAETIEEIRNKFHKQLFNNEVNTDHDEDNFIDAYMVESYLIDTEERLTDIQNRGIKEAEMNSWVVSYKIEDDEQFQRVLDGELNGFSVEVFLNKELQRINNKSENNKLKIMKNKLIERLTALVNEFAVEEGVEATEETKFEDATSVDGQLYRWSEVGEPVFVVTISDETGEEVEDAVAEGDYEFEDGSMIKVDADGNLVEFVPAPDSEEPVEDTPEEEMEAVVEEAAEEVVEEEAEETATSDKAKSIEELVDLNKDGYYTVEVFVEGGAITYGTVYANTWKELDLKMEELETLRKEKTDLEAKVEELNATVLAEPVTDSTEGTETKTEVDVTKLSNYEKVLYRNGLLKK